MSRVKGIRDFGRAIGLSEACGACGPPLSSRLARNPHASLIATLVSSSPYSIAVTVLYASPTLVAPCSLFEASGHRKPQMARAAQALLLQSDSSIHVDP